MTTNLFFKNLSDLVKKLNESRESENGSYIKSNKSSEYNSKSLDGAIKRFLWRRSFDYLFTEPATNPSRRSSINWEKAMLLLETEDELRRRDPKRAILWSAPFARYILRNLINSQEIDLTFLSDTNPLRIKYGNKFSPRNPWDKFEFSFV